MTVRGGDAAACLAAVIDKLSFHFIVTVVVCQRAALTVIAEGSLHPLPTRVQTHSSPVKPRLHPSIYFLWEIYNKLALSNLIV